MATLVLGNIGEKVDLRIRQGADFGPIIATMKDNLGVAVNLTGCTLSGAVKKKASDAVAAAVVQATIIDATAGRYKFWIPHAATATMKAGAKIDAPESAYVWDFEMVDSLNQIIPLYYGDVQVLRNV
jgi:hypothetical protein